MTVVSAPIAASLRVKCPEGLVWSLACAAVTALVVGVSYISSSFEEKTVSQAAVVPARVVFETAPAVVENEIPLQVADIIRSSRQKLTKEQVASLAAAIIEESLAHGIDPLFVAAVAKAESTFNHQAVSSRGAMGLLQIMPATGEYISGKLAIDWDGQGKLHDARYNLRLGIGYLKYLDRVFDGNVRHILIAYNWGPGNLKLSLKNGGVPPQSTLNYADKILNNYRRWKSAQNLILARGLPSGGEIQNLG